MASVLVGRRAVAARQLALGEAAAFAVRAGQLVQIVDLAGQQVATMLAFRGDDPVERLSTAATITANKSIVLARGSSLRSNRRAAMLTLVEDSVGRHDMLTASPAPDPDAAATTNGTPTCQESLAAVAAEHEIAPEALPDPIHWFKNVIIKQRGEIEERESLSEPNDTVVVRAEMDVLVIIANCPPTRARRPATNGRHATLLVRIYGEP